MLAAPFPWFGGKRRIADLVWSRFGAVSNYVEPFFGSGAVLLGRPLPFQGTETVNDRDGLLANFWRSLQADPDAVAEHADWPVNENDLHARHAWLVGQKDSLQGRLEGDPDYHDARIAGWWVWGISCWIGSGFCSGAGPWQVAERDGARQLVHLGDAGRGVNRKRVHLGDALRGYFASLAERLRHVRVCCGDWSRVMGDTPMFPCARGRGAATAVFLDPPYADTARRTNNLYRADCLKVAHAAREWAVAHGDDPAYRIALCGYDGEHAMPDSWEAVEGKAGSGNGYGGQAKRGYANRRRERVWFSPYCLRPATEEMPLFQVAGG